MGLLLPRLLKNAGSGQTTVQIAGDDADLHPGLSPSWTHLTAGAYAGTTNVDNPHYAAATISFASGTKRVSDSANGLVTVLTGDTIIIRGSGSNDKAVTVSDGGHAGYFVTTEALTDEVAGAVVSLCKRHAHSNACGYDNNKQKTWLSSTTSGAKIGPASDGKLFWDDATRDGVLHAADANLALVTYNGVTYLRITGGAAEAARYHVGDCIALTGFANAVNNRRGYRITAIATADNHGGLITALDLTLWIGNATLIAEVAGGTRSIKLICQSAFSYCAAANAAGLGGFTDWRVPSIKEFMDLANAETSRGMPDGTSFPSFPTGAIWSSTTRNNGGAYTNADTYAAQDILTSYAGKTAALLAAGNLVTLVRG